MLVNSQFTHLSLVSNKNKEPLIIKVVNRKLALNYWGGLLVKGSQMTALYCAYIILPQGSIDSLQFCRLHIGRDIFDHAFLVLSYNFLGFIIKNNTHVLLRIQCFSSIYMFSVKGCLRVWPFSSSCVKESSNY